jgi:hypothetical protein
MKKLKELVPLAEEIVKDLTEKINFGLTDFKTAETEIVRFINQLGHLLCQEVIDGIEETLQENHIIVNGDHAYFRENQNLRFKDRFGQEIIKKRRAYKIKGKAGGYYPLDEKLGFDKCRGYSPLMTYLLTFYGGCESYDLSAKQLSETLAFSISATAVQNNTEMTGRRIESEPNKIIPAVKQQEKADLMIVEIDGTMSPQITEKKGVKGWESLKQPTEYKECNIISLEKYRKEVIFDKWSGAQYGPRANFEQYVHKTGISFGQMVCEQIVFIADGAKHNWEIQMNNFPDAVPILDFYHATEHLAAFCELLTDKKAANNYYTRWKTMLYEGELLQFFHELRRSIDDKIGNRSEAVKHYNYFKNNKERMHYMDYRKKGYPIGSGLVEGNCKLIVGKRFKGNGMRWKKQDNEDVLKVRLAICNNNLSSFFIPSPQEYAFASSL